MATNLVDLSNPLLHAAKALNHANIASLAGVKDALFKLFALTFLVVRVITMPLSVVYPGWRDAALTPMPPLSYYLNNGFMTVIYAMQARRGPGERGGVRAGGGGGG